MAVVYRVRDAARDEEIALKQLLPPRDPSLAREVTALFEREFYTLAQLSHPGVVEVYDYGNDEGRPYYTMQLVDGGDLGQRAPWPYQKACELAAQVCSALSLLHSRRLVHRDLSPRNIRCTRAGAAKLIDFGAMVPMGPNAQSVGTPPFVAPEVLHQLSLDGRTDLFSLGATLYFALTGRTPFAARTFADLREAWRNEPLPPSQLSASIPPALDALVLGLLRIDPAQRPRSAFEVMQRLSAIAGIDRVESAEISQAYLATPTLIGRELEQATFRALVARAAKGHGGGFSIEGAAGLGRSRLLDACVLDAKTLGAMVVRVSGSAASSAPFSSGLQLAEHLLETQPTLALECADEAGAAEVLFQVPEGSSERRLRTRSELTAERHVLHAAFTNWIRAIARRQTLVIAVDDAERADRATLGLLAGLANEAQASTLVLAIGVLTPVTPGLSPALDLLRSHCKTVELAPLTRAQTLSLFSSVFADAPHVAMLSDRVHEIAGGNPRDSMALAGHLLDSGEIRYADGSWILPAELTVTDLPADAAEALRVRLAALPELARRLAELQALALPGAWTRADFAELAGASLAGRVDESLNALVRHGVLASDGVSYTVAHSGVRATISAGLDADTFAARHLALAEHCARHARFGLPEVHHLLLAGAEQRALDRFAELIAEVADQTDFLEASGMLGKDIAAVFERGHALAVKLNRPPRQIFELARHLTALAVITDNTLHARYGVAWSEQLARDSGLEDYRALDPNLPPSERLQQALQRAIARYEATPEAERVYRFDEAIKYLARYVSICIAVGVRMRDTKLIAETPSMLEPFAGLSPVIEALWQNAISADEMNFRARPQRARVRALSVYERLGQCQGDELRYVDMIRNAIACAISSLDIALGNPTAEEWLAIAEKDPLQQVNASYLRRLAAIMQGDREAAERYRRQAEVLAVQASARQMFTAPLRNELVAQARLADLAGVKHAYDQIAQLAREEPGWESQECYARGVYQRMRGDLTAARAAFERCFELTDPDSGIAYPCVATWLLAVASYMDLLMDLGQHDAARELGLRAIARCEVLEVDAPAADLERELALAEARLGEHEEAARRIDALIAAREGAVESHRAVDYEIRARIAIEARDSETAVRFAKLAAAEFPHEGGERIMSRQLQLLEQARRAGVELEVPTSAFVSSVLGEATRPERRQALTKVASLFYDTREPAVRSRRALEALCEATRANAGALYIAGGSGLTETASFQLTSAPELQSHIGNYWLQQLHGGDMTALTVEVSESMLPAEAVFRDPNGCVYQLMLLKCIVGDTLIYVGVAALAIADGAPPSPGAWDLAGALSTRLLELGDAEGVLPG